MATDLTIPSPPATTQAGARRPVTSYPNGSHYHRVIFVCNATPPPYLPFMKQSDHFRENADNCLQLAERADGQPAFRRYLRMAQAWAALAHEQDWLDGEISPLTIRAA